MIDRVSVYPHKVTDEYGERYTKICLTLYADAEYLKTIPSGGSNQCWYCGHPFATDFDFWSHFTVTDIRYSNLGECPVKLAGGK